MKIKSQTLKALVLPLLLGSLAGTANATIFSYQASLDGPSEFPANASPGTGFATADYNDTLHTLFVQANFTGLTGGVTASHIHAATAVAGAGTAGVATPTPTFPGFPSGVTSGSYSMSFDLTLTSSWNGAYISANGGTAAGAEAAFASALAQGKAYYNIHTTTFGGGEIRGFLTAVPEPSSMALIGLGSLALMVVKRRKQ